MAFGQQQGRPASARQLKTLEALLRDAGYAGFRDARGPLRLTQRQGGGKFTTDEADALIEQLEAESEASAATEDGTEGTPARSSEPEPPPARAGGRAQPVPRAATGVTKATGVATGGATSDERREARQAFAVRDLPAKILARELEKRGWILIPPEDLTASDPTASGGPA
ncbi:MAG: hypothetical protein JWM47_1640 [Acidimicrobiales bacterium]|nr:hypothetical protein [Acidimicrobiales bacterium]